MEPDVMQCHRTSLPDGVHTACCQAGTPDSTQSVGFVVIRFARDSVNPTYF